MLEKRCFKVSRKKIFMVNGLKLILIKYLQFNYPNSKLITSLKLNPKLTKSINLIY